MKPYYEEAGITIYQRKHKENVILTVCAKAANVSQLCTRVSGCAETATCGGLGLPCKRHKRSKPGARKAIASACAGVVNDALRLLIGGFAAISKELPLACVAVGRLSQKVRFTFKGTSRTPISLEIKPQQKQGGKCHWQARGSENQIPMLPPCERQAGKGASQTRSLKSRSGNGPSTSNGGMLYSLGISTPVGNAALKTAAGKPYTSKLITSSPSLFDQILLLTWGMV